MSVCWRSKCLQSAYGIIFLVLIFFSVILTFLSEQTQVFFWANVFLSIADIFHNINLSRFTIFNVSRTYGGCSMIGLRSKMIAA